MRRWWIVSALLLGLAGAAAWELRPARRSAQELAGQIARQLAAGDTAALGREAAPALLPYLGDAHLAAAIAPLAGASVHSVRLVQIDGTTAEATVQYASGRIARIELVNQGGRWLLASLT